MTPDNPPCPLPFCGSVHVYKTGTKTRKGSKYQKYECQDCGHIWTSKEPISGDIIDHRRRR